MQNAAEAYGSIARSSVDPRELEASLLVKAAMKLNRAQEEVCENDSALNEALNYNRKLWTVFASAVTDPESPLPQHVRENIASLSVFIFKHTMDALSNSVRVGQETLFISASTAIRKSANFV